MEVDRNEKKVRDICNGILDIECERDWSVDLGATLGDVYLENGKNRQKIFAKGLQISNLNKIGHLL